MEPKEEITCSKKSNVDSNLLWLLYSWFGSGLSSIELWETILFEFVVFVYISIFQNAFYFGEIMRRHFHMHISYYCFQYMKQEGII